MFWALKFHLGWRGENNDIQFSFICWTGWSTTREQCDWHSLVQAHSGDLLTTRLLTHWHIKQTTSTIRYRGNCVPTRVCDYSHCSFKAPRTFLCLLHWNVSVWDPLSIILWSVQIVHTSLIIASTCALCKIYSLTNSGFLKRIPKDIEEF